MLSCDERKLKDACSHNREKYDQVDHHNLVHVRRIAEDLRGNLTESCPLLEQVELFKHTLESVITGENFQMIMNEMNRSRDSFTLFILSKDKVYKDIEAEI